MWYGEEKEYSQNKYCKGQIKGHAESWEILCTCLLYLVFQYQGPAVLSLIFCMLLDLDWS